jgi:aspartate aminotransferase
MNFSNKAALLKPSPTLKMSALAQELKTKGHDVINLTVGEPDWNTFKSAKAHGLLAIGHNVTRYTPASGTTPLKTRLAQHLSQELGIPCTNKEIAVGPGAKFLIYSTFQMLLNPGDEVLLPSPYWVSYPTMIELSGGTPRIVETQASNQFKPTIKELQSAVTDKTKLLVLCSPNNPTGTALNRDELKELGEFLKDHPHITLLSDDIYNRLYFHETESGESLAPHILHLYPELKDRVVCVGGASKSFAMTGWRIGWIRADSQLIGKVSDYLSQTTSNPCSISQEALLGVLDDYQEELHQSLTQLKEKSQLVKTFLTHNRIEFVNPDGAFYFFISLKPWLNQVTSSGQKIVTSLDFSEYLLHHYFVATVAGSDFGAEGWLRLSFANTNQNLTEGLKRIGSLLQDLKPLESC